MNRNKVLDFIYFIIRAIYTIFLFLLYNSIRNNLTHHDNYLEKSLLILLAVLIFFIWCFTLSDNGIYKQLHIITQRLLDKKWRNREKYLVEKYKDITTSELENDCISRRISFIDAPPPNMIDEYSSYKFKLESKEIDDIIKIRSINKMIEHIKNNIIIWAIIAVLFFSIGLSV